MSIGAHDSTALLRPASSIIGSGRKRTPLFAVPHFVTPLFLWDNTRHFRELLMFARDYRREKALMMVLTRRTFPKFESYLRSVGWVERSETHRRPRSDGFRERLNPSYANDTFHGIARLSLATIASSASPRSTRLGIVRSSIRRPVKTRLIIVINLSWGSLQGAYSASSNANFQIRP